jgi:hypothetical protein
MCSTSRPYTGRADSEAAPDDYKVESFKFLDYTIKELEEKNLVILLPFYLLKLRKRVNAALKLPAAKSKAKLSALAAELREIEEELMSVLERSRKAGVISDSDSLEILEQSGKMHKELYSSYEEFMKEEAMLLKRLKTHGKKWVADRDAAEQKAKLAEQKAELAQQEKEREVAQVKLEKDQLVKLEKQKAQRAQRQFKKRVSELEKQLEEARKQ